MPQTEQLVAEPEHYTQLASQDWQELVELKVPRGQLMHQLCYPFMVQLAQSPLHRKQVFELLLIPKPMLQAVHCEAVVQVRQKEGQALQSLPSRKNPKRQVWHTPLGVSHVQPIGTVF